MTAASRDSNVNRYSGVLDADEVVRGLPWARKQLCRFQRLFQMMALNEHRLAPASREESVVFGACRPGYQAEDPTAKSVADWIENLTGRGIERVCCLLSQPELDHYENLLPAYEAAFGTDRVLHVPIEDRQVVAADQYHEQIRPFLTTAVNRGEPVVVHCSAGFGRTGHVVALWLASDCGFSLGEAIEEVKRTGRHPLEAATRSELQRILGATSTY